jgi:mannose-1-phosphate guanylyltransferase
MARKVKKAVVLCGNRSTTLLPMTRYASRSMLPVLHQPAIYWQFQQLEHAGIDEVILCIDQDSADLIGYLDRFHHPEIRIHLHVEQTSMGTGGSLRDVLPLIGAEDVLIINNTLFYYGSLQKMIAAHVEKDTEVTLGVTMERRRDGMFGTVIAFPQGDGHAVTGFEAPGVRVPRNTNERYLLRGVYAFGPTALGLLKTHDGYLDLKEEFLPELQQANTKIHPFEMEGEIRNLHRPSDYTKLVADFLARKPCWLNLPANITEIGKGIFLHGEASISPTANLIGPLWIDDGCRIDRGAQVIGPTVLGTGCRIQEGAMVIETIAWASTSISAEASVRRAIVCSGSSVPQAAEVEEAIIIPDCTVPDELTLIGPQLAVQAAVEDSESSTMDRQTRFYQLIKWCFDLATAFLGLSSRSRNAGSNPPLGCTDGSRYRRRRRDNSSP